MTAEDIAAVSKLIQASWLRTYGPIVGADETVATSRRYHAPERIAAELDDPYKHATVADSNGEIVGYALVLTSDDDARIVLDRLHIEPVQFGTGLAAALMRAAFAEHPSASVVELEVLEGNDRALAFYRKHGFRTVRMITASYDAVDHRSHIMMHALEACG